MFEDLVEDKRWDFPETQDAFVKRLADAMFIHMTYRRIKYKVEKVLAETNYRRGDTIKLNYEITLEFK